MRWSRHIRCWLRAALVRMRLPRLDPVLACQCAKMKTTTDWVVAQGTAHRRRSMGGRLHSRSAALAAGDRAREGPELREPGAHHWSREYCVATSDDPSQPVYHAACQTLLPT